MGAAKLAQVTEVQRGSDQNLAAFMREMALVEGARVVDQDGLCIVAAHHPNPGPYRNAAILTSDGLSAAEVLSVACGFFAKLQRNFVLWAREHGEHDGELVAVAEERGWRLLEPDGLPQIYREGSPGPVEPRPGVTVSIVEDEEMRKDFLRVNAEAWGMPGVPLDLARRIFFEPALLDDAANSRFGVLAYLDGRPASTCFALVHPTTVIGGYWGATAPWALGHGLHDLTTRTVYNHAFALRPGARYAVCQNSPGAAKNLARMGFEHLTSYRRYLVPTT